MSDQYIKLMDKHFNNWAYLTSGRSFINIKTGVMINKEAFSDLLGNIDFPLKIVVDKNGVTSLAIAKTAADSYNKNHFKDYTKVFSTTIDSDYKCGDVIFDMDGVDSVNIWNGSSIKPIKHDNDAVELFLDLVGKILPANDVDNIVRWMAHVVQMPTKKVLWAPILVGTKGNGKTSIAIVISKIIGDRYSKVIDKDTLKDTFNGWADGKCFSVIEEIKVGNDFAVIDKIKQYVTNRKITVRSMQRDARDATNHCDFMICSNHVDALKIENDERRWYPVLTNQRPGDETAVEKTFGKNKGAAYFRKFHENTTESKEGLESICYYLSNLDLSDFNSGTAPESEHMSEFVQLTMSNNAMLIRDAIADHDLLVSDMVLKKSIDDAGNAYRLNIPNTKTFSNAMLELGYVAFDGRVNVSGKHTKSVLYVKNNSRHNHGDRAKAWSEYKSKRCIGNTFHYAVDPGGMILKSVK